VWGSIRHRGDASVYGFPISRRKRGYIIRNTILPYYGFFPLISDKERRKRGVAFSTRFILPHSHCVIFNDARLFIQFCRRSTFESGHRIFANKDLLKIGHVPKLTDRRSRRGDPKLAKRLNGAVHGYSPENVMIYGKTGTGKSLVSKHVCQRAQNAAQDGVEIEQRISTVLKTILRLRRSPHLLRS